MRNTKITDAHFKKQDKRIDNVKSTKTTDYNYHFINLLKKVFGKNSKHIIEIFDKKQGVVKNLVITYM